MRKKISDLTDEEVRDVIKSGKENKKVWKLMYPTKEDRNKAVKDWNKKHPDRARENIQKSQFKRRILGFSPLNFYFKNSDAHHYTQQQVMYIPEVIHNSISHNIFTGKNIEEINSLAFQWYTEGWT